jgi:hypothetical protein
MALQNTNYRESAQYKGYYDTAFHSTYALRLKPQTYGEVIDRYGPGLSLTSFSHLAGRTMGVRNSAITIFENGAPYRPVKISAAIDTAPVSSAAITFNVADGSDAYMRQFFTITIPAEYTNKDIPQEMRITGVAGTWLGSFHDITAAITSTITDVWVAVGASAFGKGSGQPDPMATGSFSRSTNERIIKTTAGFEGATLYKEEWEDFDLKDGGRGLWTKSIAEIDFDLDNQCDSALLVGQKITNTAGNTQLSITGDTKAVPSAEGLEEIMGELAQELTWDATGFGVDQFRQLRPLLENVGVVNMQLDLFAGSDLNSSIESEMIDFLTSNAGGTKYWNEINKVGFMVNSIKLDSVQTNVAVLHALSNPNKYGLDSYNFKKQGYLFTQGEYPATLQDAGMDEKMRLPHLTMGYPNGNGENRQRKFMMRPGVNGVEGLPNVATTDLDGWYMYGFQHLIPIWNHMYKTVKINYDASQDAGA